MKKIIPIIVAGLLFSCQNETENKKTLPDLLEKDVATAIKPPFKDVGTRIEQLSINASEGGTLALANGGSIEVPSNAFVDSEGNVVSGDVNIQIQEYHTLGQLISSGIPIEYDSAGVEYTFITGGMFNIEGNQNGKPIEVQKGKELGVNLASYDDTPCYNFYKIDKATGKWDYKDTKHGTPNPNASSVTQPKLPATTKEDDFILEISAENAVSEFKDVLWKYDGNDEARIKDLLSKTPDLKGNLSKSDKSLFSYTLEINKGRKPILIPITPAFDESNMELAMEKFKKAQEDFTQKLEEEDKVPQGQMIRSISIPSFGTYNWDYVYNNKDYDQYSVDIQLDDATKVPTSSVFLIMNSDRALVNLGSMSNPNSIYFKADKSASILISLPNNEYATVHWKDFKDAFNKRNGNRISLVAKKGKDKITSQTQINSIIASI